MKALTEQTPVEIDTALSEIHVRLYVATDWLERLLADARRIAKQAERTDRQWDINAAAKATAKAEAQKTVVESIATETEPYEAEYARRGGWTRAWKVTNIGGHIHHTMGCSTCFPTTQFAWLPQVSGMPEGEIVELAAAAACTVCYPTAPVDKPTQLFTQSEQAAQAEREARAAAKVEREQKRLKNALLPSGEPLNVRLRPPYSERISTLATARKELTDALVWNPQWITEGDFPVLIAAIAAREGKTSEIVVEEARKRAAKRR